MVNVLGFRSRLQSVVMSGGRRFRVSCPSGVSYSGGTPLPFGKTLVVEGPRNTQTTVTVD